MFGYVQQLIIEKLLQNEELKYSEIAPKEVDDDLYNYHLQFLVKKGFIQKKDGLYFLSDLGRSAASSLDISGGEIKPVKVGVLSMVVRKNGGDTDVLMQKRFRQPYHGDINPGILGKLLQGEDVLEASRRKLEEETGLICNFRLIGLVRKIRRTKQNKVFEDVILHVCLGENPSGSLVVSNIFGEHFWVPFGEALSLLTGNKAKGSLNKEILEELKGEDSTLFYLTERSTLEDL